MARSKTRILEVFQKDHAKYIKAQIELENGEVIIAGFERIAWYRSPEEITRRDNEAMSLPPTVVYGGRSSQKSK